MKSIVDVFFELKKKCTGCEACSNICAMNAIDMLKDECGFWYPHVNERLCINCGLCARVCPGMSP